MRQRIEAIQLSRKPFEFEEFATLASNQSTTSEWMPRSTHIMDLVNADLYRRISIDEEGPIEWFFAVDRETSLTQYAVKVADVHLPPLRAGCQVGVWADQNFATPTPFAATVFWEILFARHDMISDKIQTEFGRRFWIKRIGEAYQKHLCIYLLKVSGSKIVYIERLRTIQNFNGKLRDIWGSGVKMQNVRLAITKNPLRFDNDT